MILSKFSVKLSLILTVIVFGISVVPLCYAQTETKTVEQPAGGPEAQPPGITEEPAAAAPDRPTVNINNTFYSQYIWRGFELSHNSFVMFPSVTVSYKGFSINWWGDIDTDYAGSPDGLQCWEQDYLAWYSNSWKKLNYTLGYIYYHTKAKPTGDDQEMWISLGLSTLLNPTFSAWRDIESHESWYFNLALSHSFPICKDWVEWKYDWSFDLGGWVSYWYMHNMGKADFNYSAWHDAQVWAGLKIPLSDVCSVTPKMQYSFPMSTKARNYIKSGSFDGDDANFFYGGLILDYNF